MGKAKLVSFKATKRFSHNNKVIGVGGSYDIDIELAKEWKRMGRGSYQDSHGVNQDESESVEEYIPSNPFCASVRDNAAEILKILEEAARAKYDNERADDVKKDENVELSQNEQTEETSKNEDTEEVESNEEVENEEEEKEADEEISTDTSLETQETEETEEKTPILDGFPGKAELEAKGIKFIEDIPKSKKGLQELDIPSRIANQIGARLAELK